MFSDSRILWHLVLAVAVSEFAATARAERSPLAHHSEFLTVDSGIHDGNVADEARLAFRKVVEAPGAPWMRVHFGEFHLGTASYLTITSFADGGFQRFEAWSLPVSSNASAYFNGDAVQVDLFVAPEDSGVFVTINEMTVGEWPTELGPADDNGGIASICGNTDDRVASSDSRVGRLFGGGCTGWLVSNGAVLTAGHCGNPDGNITGVIEFNVPLSTTNGNPVMGDPLDQYPVIGGSSSFESDGTGEDWCVFAIGPNSTTGARAHLAQGFFQMTTRIPPEDATMRVTGYGLDNRPAGSGGAGASCCDEDNDNACEFDCNNRSLTQQTHTGRYDQISGSTHEYEVDTTPANSGSPIIRESGGFSVGIHTAGGCDDFLSGNENHGTWFGYAPLSNALQSFNGSNRIYLNWANVSDFPFGHVLHPAKNLPQAIALVPDHGFINAVEGNYPASAGNTGVMGDDGKSFTFETPVGGVLIGH